MTLEEFRLACENIGIPLSKEQLNQFDLYADLLKEWNEKMNLTSIVEKEEVFEKHFYDCILPCKTISFHEKEILDIGSGAGFPGMVFAIVYPDAHVTLVDATRKKFLFLEEVKNRLGIHNVSFHVGRVEEMKKERESFDIVSSRGFAALRILLEVAAPLIKVGGTIIAMKSQRGEEELKEAYGTIVKLKLKEVNLQRASLPSGDVRLNYLFQKTEKTDGRYPRSWADITKKPLKIK